MTLSVNEYNEMRGLWEDMKRMYEGLERDSQEVKNKIARMEQRMQYFDEQASRPPIVTDEDGSTWLDGPRGASDSWKSLVTRGASLAVKSGVPLHGNYDYGNSGGMRAMLQAVRKGYGSLTQEQKSLVPLADTKEAPNVPGLEIKGLTITEDTSGGFFAPPEFVPEIIKGFVAYSPLIQFVRNRTTTQRSVQMPKRTGTITAQWVGEHQTRTELTGYALGRVEIPTNEMYGLVLISEQDLEDPAFNLETEIRNEISEQFGVALGTALITGDGLMRPQGVLMHSSTLIDKSGSNGAYTTDSLIDCAYKLPDPYAANARWLIKRQELANIRKLKYAADSHYIWEPSVVGSEPATLLGYPITTMPDMPAAATASHSMILGDFNRYYCAVSRVSMVFKRLEERWVENSQVGIYARMRIGGQVLLPEAARIYSLEA